MLKTLPIALDHLITKHPFANARNAEAEISMPSLLRFLFVVGVIAGLTLAGMAALVAFVEPQPREMSQPLPANKFNR